MITAETKTGWPWSS